MPPSEQLKPGEVINGIYRVMAKIGEGGMGQVYRVEHITMGRQLALKTFHREERQDEAWERFQNEAKTIAKLNHRSIIHVYDFGITTGGTGFYLMDLVEGKTLSQRIKEHGQLEVRQALTIFIEVAQGLAYAHSLGLVHRDIKPSNIMLSPDAGVNPAATIKIVDFGLVKSSQADPKERAKAAANAAANAWLPTQGSPPYMSPEQFQNKDVDYRSDIYSFGCALFEALTGVAPFISDSALVLSMKHCTELPPTLSQASLGCEFPNDLELIQARLLAKAPGERYQHMQVVAEDLQGVLDELEKEAKNQSAAGREQAGNTTSKRIPVAISNSPHAASDAGNLQDSQNVTITPLAPARAARLLLILAPIVVFGAGLAIAVILGWRPNIPGMTGVAPPVISPSKISSSGVTPTAVSPSGVTPTAVSPSGVSPPVKTTTDPTTVQTTVVSPALEPPVTASPPPDKEPPNNSASPSTTGLSSVDAMEAAKKKPYSEVVSDAQGHKKLIFHFPGDVSLGRIVDKDSNDAFGQPARGDVSFPLGKRLRFVPSITCCTSPSYLRRFRPDDLNEVDINKNETVTSETLNYMDHLSGLVVLSIFETEINDECIPILEQFPALNTLDCSNTNVTGEGLAKLKNLKNLINLRANEIPKVSVLLPVLQKNQTVVELHIDGSPLNSADHTTLTKIKSLKSLSVSATNLTFAGLEILSHCPNLEELVVDANGLKGNSLPYFQKFPKLKTLRTNCDSWSQAEIAAFKAGLPKVQVIVEDPY